MLNICLIGNDPALLCFYYPILTLFFCIMIILYFAKLFLSSMPDKKLGEINTPFLQDTLDPLIEYRDSIYAKKESLRYRYLIAYLFTKSSIWAKTAYLYTLYSTIHNRK